MTSKPTKVIEVFFSYAHKDERLRNELEKHLAILKRNGYITIWHDRRIAPGKVWGFEINTNLTKANIILLLISPDFMASDYCESVEVKQALKRHEAGECHVIPVILRPVSWKDTAFGTLQALPTNGKPVTEWSNRDKAFLDITEGIRNVVQELSAYTLVETSENPPPLAIQQASLSILPLSQVEKKVEQAPSTAGEMVNKRVMPSDWDEEDIEELQSSTIEERFITSSAVLLGRGQTIGLLRVAVLGPPEVLLNGSRLTFSLRKAQALLLYLAVEGGLHPRSKLAAFLWPDSVPHDARTALRNAIAVLRNLLADANASAAAHSR